MSRFMHSVWTCAETEASYCGNCIEPGPHTCGIDATCDCCLANMVEP